MKPPELNNYSPSTRKYLRKNPDATENEIQCKEEAAYFARCLLMPEKSVKSMYKMVKSTNPFRTLAIKDMAIIFGVEIKEMSYRLRELKLFF